MDAKITVKLPEPLRRRAKAIAALRGETISDVVRDALEAYIAGAMERSEDVRAVDEVEGLLVAGHERVQDHADVWREIAACGNVAAVSTLHTDTAGCDLVDGGRT
jgi:predicted DNA-binding protein